MEKAPDTLFINIGIAVVVLFMILAISSPLVGLTESDKTVQDAAILDGDTNWHTLEDTVGTSETVVNSRGYAVNLSGASDSHIRSSSDVDIRGDENFTVSLWAYREENVTNQTVLSVDGRVVITYNATTNEYEGWYYDAGFTSSYKVSVSGGSASDFQHVALIKNGSELSIYRNTTQGNQTTITNGSTVTAPVNSTTWDGRLEEIRLSDDAWNQSVLNTHYNNPIDPLPTTPLGRIMFDQPQNNRQLFLWHSGYIATNNVTYATGLGGQTLQANVDYEWRQDGPQIRAISGAELDGAPVAYVTYESKSTISGYISGVTSTFSLIGVMLLVVVLGVVVFYLREPTR